MKIGVYGGSFNPVHIGHINVGVELIEKTGLDEVWYVPAKINPHKIDQKPVPIEHRIAMLELALEHYPNLVVKDLEGSREGPSFTIDTIKELLSTPGDNQYCFIVGEDSIKEFPQWKNPEEIIRLMPLVLVSRESTSTDLGLLQEHPIIYKAVRDGMVNIRVIDISSTELRERINKKLYCRHLIPEKVMDYIYENKLYSTN